VNGAKQPNSLEDSWRVLEAIGAYMTGELSDEETSSVERFVRENEEARRLAEAFLWTLSLLRMIHKESPEPPEQSVERAIARVVEEAGHARDADESANNPNHNEDRIKEVSPIMPTTTPQHHQRRLEQALETYIQGLEALEDALQTFEEALLDFEEEALYESAPEPPKGQSRRLLSIPEVCQELGWDRGTVFRSLRSGEIPSLKLGHAIKVRQEDLKKYIEG
jgi:excisionase family DNA binding protein